MEARIFRVVRICAAPIALAIAFISPASQAHGAGYRTKNFTVAAPTPQLAKEIGDAAEQWRAQLAVEWLGEALPDWSQPCPISAKVAPQFGAGGATSFVFEGGEVGRWDMRIQGSRERVLDSVLPHEITHTIFASYFRQPVPRWADEGACTTVEHRSEISKQERMLIDFLKTRRGIPFSEMFAMKEYPNDVLPLYAQGHSLSAYLIGQRGKREFLAFLADGMTDENWPRALKKHYDYDHLLALQNSWLDWVRAGRPQLHPAGEATLVAAQVPAPPSAHDVRASVTAASNPMPPSQGTDAGWRSPYIPSRQSAPAGASAAITPTPAEAQQSAAQTAAVPAAPPRVSVYDAQTRGVMWR
jgi:hypothetical protein